MARPVYVVPHTHWDREWYEPYQTFRIRLVEMLDGLLDHLERDPSYSRFLLDGQLAMVDDYLEVRPEASGRIRALVGSGRVSVGPWYTLMDEFLVSGETIVRDLEMGMERASAFGGAMAVGYLPDMFGHVAQMPQILRLAGMEHAVVWRGVPKAVDKSAFWWVAPDGSRVRAEYLVVGYSNGAAVPDDAKELVARIAAHEEEVAGFLLDGLVFMNGTDHQTPQPWLGRVVAEANAIQDDYRLEITSLPELLPRLPTEGLPVWHGELRSGARANLLMGVASNRVDTKRLAARAERALERLAEPACALFMPPEAWPASLLGLAWREVVRNAAHDSVCACSLDEVVEAVNHRYHEARTIGEQLAARAMGALAASVSQPGWLVVNPAPRRRSGTVELWVAGEQAPEGAQVLSRRQGPAEPVTLSVPEARSVLGQIRHSQIGSHTWVSAIEVEESEERIDVTIRADSEPKGAPSVEAMKAEAYAVTGRRPDALVRLHFVQPPASRVLARVADVPGFGWALWQPRDPADPVRVGDDGLSMSNGLASVQVDPKEGTFSLDGLEGFDRLVDGGDVGDTYNYCPPGEDLLVESPEAVSVRVQEAGPVRARLVLSRTFRWPAGEAGGRRVGEERVEVSTTLELHAGEALVRVRTRFRNPCRNHRLRAHFPLPRPAAFSEAECAFAVVRRGLEAEGGPSEKGIPTFPSRRFVSAGGLTVVHEGLLEYELVDVGPEGAGGLALTLLRATGMLSQAEMPYRPVPAGPFIPLEGPQMLGPVEAYYAVSLADADPYALADDALVPMSVLRSPGGGHRPPSGSALQVEGAQVSSVRRRGPLVEVRVFNPSDQPTGVRLAGASGWLVDLRGRPLSAFEEAFELGPWAIATARLTSGGPT
jgi:mannosylglycerate hydrolase